jgi:membrane protease YdiL (CAAX protease family)
VRPELGVGLLYETLVRCVVSLPLALLACWLLRRYCLAVLGPGRLDSRQPWYAALGLGALVAGAALAITLLPGLLLGSYNPASPGWEAFSYRGAGGHGPGLLALLLLASALFEELFFRAVLLALLGLLGWYIVGVLFAAPVEPARAFNWRLRVWFFCGLLANLVVALAFGAVHLKNPAVSLGAIANVSLAGLLLGFLFWQRGDILSALSFHYLWNLGLALLGLPVSGWAILPLPLGIGMRGAVPGILTGGHFGPEDSFCASLALLAGCIWLAHRQWRNQPARRRGAGSPAPLSGTEDLA